MKKSIAVLAASLFLFVIAFTSCKRNVYLVDVSQIDSIIQAQGSVVIELKEGYHVYPLLDKNDKLYKAGEQLRMGETGGDNESRFLDYFGAQAAPAYAQYGNGAFVCPKYCAIQITK